MPRLLPATLALLLAGAAHAQLPADVVFDDFTYTSTEWAETTLPDAGGERREGPPPPTGSVYGVSPWARPGAQAPARMWYRYAWQEPSKVLHLGDLVPDDHGLTFAIDPGDYPRGGCADPEDPSRVVFPQQIVTGFTARRGTWAARVRFSPVRNPDKAGVIQAFWLMSPMSARIRTEAGEDETVWNEVDHEFNNRFLGPTQRWDFDATGHRGGDGTDPGPRPMFAPPIAGAEPGNALNPERSPDGLAWSCTAVENGRGRRLSAAACSEALTDHSEGDVWSTLLMRLTDSGVSFALSAEDGDRQIVMASEPSGPPVVLPMHAVFSVHLTPGGVSTCADRADLTVPVRTGVDWFYFTPDPTATVGTVLDDVAALRQAGVARAATVPGLDLERPDRHLPAPSLRNGFGQRTAPPTLTLEAPREMRPGETTTLVALPGTRHGAYRFTWTATTRHSGGPLVTEALPPASFALPFTFPDGVDHVIVRVRMAEVDGSGRVFRQGPFRPVERRVTIRRAR